MKNPHYLKESANYTLSKFNSSKPPPQWLFQRPPAESKLLAATPVFADELLEPGCMAGITAHPGIAAFPALLLLFYHPHTTDREHAVRRDVTILLRRDDGKTWPVSRTLQPGPQRLQRPRRAADGTVLCFYESGSDMPKVQRKRDWAYANLTLARFNLECLTTR
jgi:hypothetical protein